MLMKIIIQHQIPDIKKRGGTKRKAIRSPIWLINKTTIFLHNSNLHRDKVRPNKNILKIAINFCQNLDFGF